ncbi:MAG: PIN domain-containing protein [Propionibacteriaceae bacterium]|jgi:predicted nucleic-acid-binding protein|nr:PIN domain-containing protein [Propionibacteriaceae bacterium]
MALAALDTNVLLRLVIPDLPDQQRRARALLTLPGARYLVSDYVVVELVFTLDRHYGLTRDQIADTVSALIALDTFACHSERLAAALAFWRTHPKLSFEDCLMAGYAAARGAVPLWTFDHNLATQHPSAREVPADQ